MQPITNNALLMMERSMNFLWTKQTAILDNLSNVETPNYKAKYVTFEETFRKSLQSAYENNLSSMRSAIETSTPLVRIADETAKRDGNGVDATEQGIELARNALQIQNVYNAISSDLTLLRTAIRGQ